MRILMKKAILTTILGNAMMRNLNSMSTVALGKVTPIIHELEIAVKYDMATKIHDKGTMKPDQVTMAKSDITIQMLNKALIL